MQKNIDAQARRRKDAVRSAVVSSLVMLLSAALLAGLRWGFHVEGFWGAVLLLMIVADLGMIIPVWMLLKTRLKEIEGGEEDAAAQY